MPPVRVRPGKSAVLCLSSLTLTILACWLPASAADLGVVDPSFNPILTYQGAQIAESFTQQPDGKILVSGIFDYVNGTPTADIARLNADGSADPAFSTQTDAEVPVVALQPDGKILIGGYFSQVNGVARSCLARLNADGSLDPSFTGPALSPNAILPQADGSIVIVGLDADLFGLNVDGVEQLNADGSRDTAFAPTSINDRSRNTVDPQLVFQAVQAADGQVLISGLFDLVNDATHTSLVRLGAVSTPPVINLKAKNRPVDESGANGLGVFKLTRTGDLSQPLVVNLRVKGHAKNGVDYTIGNVAGGATTFTKKFKVDKFKKKIHITPLDLGITGGDMESIKLVLLPGDGYTVGAESIGKLELVQDH